MLTEKRIACITLYLLSCIGLNFIAPDRYAALYDLLQAVFFFGVVASLGYEYLSRGGRKTVAGGCVLFLLFTGGLSIANGAASAFHYWDVPLDKWCETNSPRYDAFGVWWVMLAWALIVAGLTRLACNMNR